MATESSQYDAVVVVSFGGPERREDVMPFLENVLRGKRVPEARKLEVAEHYYLFDGRSPIGGETRSMVAALEAALRKRGVKLPVYLGNRNWHPYLEDTLRQMRADGVRRALAFVTAAFGSYSGCRQYLEDIARARAAVGADAPAVDKLRLFFNHPAFVAIEAERVAAALQAAPEGRAAQPSLVFTAHSIPVNMAVASPYVQQLEECCRLVAARVGAASWRLAFQSRSGPPQQPWLEPSLEAVLRELRAEGVEAVAVAPIGFLSDHMEVVFDLDVEAQQLCAELGLRMTRAGTAGNHPAFADLIAELIGERMEPAQERRAAGSLAAWADSCAPDCCMG